MIKIYGVNRQQQEILETLWNMESLEDIDDWVDELNEHKQQQVRLMQELLMLAAMDELVETEADCREANRIIARIQRKLDSAKDS